VLESSTLGAAGGEAADRANTSSAQHVEQLAHSAMSRSSMSLGVAGESPAPAQQSRHPPLGYGFSKYQLTLLRNQILAFKKLRTRKVRSCVQLYLRKFCSLGLGFDAFFGP
jgi:hypothetical protein